METYIIGDIHGYVNILRGLVKQLPLKTEDEIILLGDCIDRGPESRQTIEFILELQGKYKLTALKGNHEAAMIQSIKDPFCTSWLIKYVGIETIESYSPEIAEKIKKELKYYVHNKIILDKRERFKFSLSDFFDILPKSHRHFFISMQNYLNRPEFFASHSGFNLSLPLDNQPESNYYNSEPEKLLKSWEGPNFVIIGHRPVNRIIPNSGNNPYISDYIALIDTGVYETGTLSCIRVSDRKFFQFTE